MGSSSDNMLSKIVSLSLVTVVCCQWPAAVPTVPGNIPGLQEGTLGAAQWWTAQIAHAGQVAHHVGKRQAEILNIPGGAQHLQNQIIWQQQQINAHHVGKRQAEILNIPGGAQFLLNHLAWQQQQANHVGKRSATLPAVPGAGQWWQQQLLWQQQQLNEAARGKRSAGVYPAGVSAASCPNYPYCNLAPIVPVGYVNTAGYPAGVSPALCANYPYCS